MKTLTNYLVTILNKMHYVGGILLVMSHLSQATDLVLNAEIPEPPPCNVSVNPPSLSTANWKVESKDIPNGKDISPSQRLSISLTGCGPGGAAKLPAINLTSPDQDTPPNANTGGGYILRNASSTSTGYWFVIQSKENGAFTGNDLYNMDPAKKKNIVTLLDPSGNPAVAGQSGTGMGADIYVGVTCATKTVSSAVTDPCKSSVGTLNATLNLEFIYK